MTYYIYIIYSEQYDKYYVGYSQNPWERLIKHNTVPFNTFTSKYRPWCLRAVFKVGELKTEAIKLEKFIKKQKSRILLEKLIDSNFILTGKLAQLVRVPHMRN
ncbi:GIY-YIG nuclease family protein [Tamlana sp. 62-3]|uniref:GIY-YIG nuclease family protein n=1 Tax=Neotamlana sargassicola TaxID=2883125 RepID=A0A9X1I645_9FLAO|nr:GIY-YIG nuclease family protein [Tamlana sargassicola]MCB4807434.1 GIY-YIG nuclease family protein [Tamlana sargassicola]